MKERTDVQVSKYDIPTTGIPLSADGVVVSRLTRMARSPMLREPGGRPEGSSSAPGAETTTAQVALAAPRGEAGEVASEISSGSATYQKPFTRR